MDPSSVVSKLFENLPAKERLRLKLSSARSNRLPNEKRVELRKNAEEEYTKAMQKATQIMSSKREASAST
jgi:hypothetical protein